jgi:hypothetical protein
VKLLGGRRHLQVIVLATPLPARASEQMKLLECTGATGANGTRGEGLVL